MVMVTVNVAVIRYMVRDMTRKALRELIKIGKTAILCYARVCSRSVVLNLFTTEDHFVPFRILGGPHTIELIFPQQLHRSI
jgi:hypothetical protein